MPKGKGKIEKSTDGAGTETTKASYCIPMPDGGQFCGEVYKISGDGNNAGTEGDFSGKGVGVGFSWAIWFLENRSSVTGGFSINLRKRVWGVFNASPKFEILAYGRLPTR